jgi:hypothetical protein
MRGTPWTGEAQTIMEREAGRLSAEEIGRLTGHTAETVRRRIRDAGLPAYVAAHRAMTRRDRLLISAAGLFVAAE